MGDEDDSLNANFGLLPMPANDKIGRERKGRRRERKTGRTRTRTRTRMETGCVEAGAAI